MATAVSTPAPQRAAGRKRLAKAGKALSDGSFPIPNIAYLKKAMRAVGRAAPGKRPKLARLIRKRARQLGAMSLVKGSWADNSQSAKAMANALEAELLEFARSQDPQQVDEVRIQREVREYTSAVTAELLEFAGVTPVANSMDGPRTTTVGTGRSRQRKMYRRLRKQGVPHSKAMSAVTSKKARGVAGYGGRAAPHKKKGTPARALANVSSSSVIELAGGSWHGLGRGKGWAFIRDGQKIGTNTDVQHAQREKLSDNKKSVYDSARNVGASHDRAMTRTINADTSTAKGRKAAAKQTPEVTSVKPANQMTKEELASHLAEYHSGGPKIGRKSGSATSKAQMATQHDKIHEMVANGGASGNSVADMGVAHSHGATSSSSGHNVDTSSKQAIIDHLTGQHGVSGAMLRGGGGPNGSSRSLSSLQSTLRSFEQSNTPESLRGQRTPKNASDFTKRLAEARDARASRPQPTSTRTSKRGATAEKAGFGSTPSNTRKTFNPLALQGQAKLDYSGMDRNARQTYSGHREEGLTHKQAYAKVKSSSELRAVSAKATRDGAASTTVQKTLAVKTGASHDQLLAARKAARAQYPAGHPERLKVERAVRQSQKARRSA